MDNGQDKKSEIPQEKREQTEIRKTFIKEPKDFETLKSELQEKIKKKKEKQPKIEAQNLKINISKPEKEAKTPANGKKSLVKITPDQMNMLVNGISNTVTFIRKTEDVTEDETKPFSSALYEVADANGWLDDLAFLPYLVLAASGTQLAIVILSKPSKQKVSKEIIEEVKTDLKSQLQSSSEIPKGNTYDVINPDELVNKINSVR